jgi:hypothetical protein
VANIRFERNLRIPEDLAAVALGELLDAIAAQEGPWRGFSLHVAFGDLHLPDVGYVAVPIALTVDKDSSDAHAFHIRFTSAHLPAAFPGFKGTMRVNAATLGESTLYLSGAYELPMQLFGKFLDSAFTPGVAETALKNFVEEIGTACEARVNQREADFARYRFYSRSPR